MVDKVYFTKLLNGKQFPLQWPPTKISRLVVQRLFVWSNHNEKSRFRSSNSEQSKTNIAHTRWLKDIVFNKNTCLISFFSNFILWTIGIYLHLFQDQKFQRIFRKYVRYLIVVTDYLFCSLYSQFVGLKGTSQVCSVHQQQFNSIDQFDSFHWN